MNKTILFGLLSGVISTSLFAADTGSGVVTFTGSVISAPCSIAPGADKQEVDLGQVSDITLGKGGSSTAQSFNIELQGCNLTDKNTVTVQFNGTETLDGSGLLQITGDATGAAVKIMNASGSQIAINSATTQNYVAGDNKLRFQAALQGLAGSTVEPGSFQAVTNFTLAYN